MQDAAILRELQLLNKFALVTFLGLWGLGALVFANVYELNVIKTEWTSRQGPFRIQMGSESHITEHGIRPSAPGMQIYQDGRHIGSFQITMDTDK